MGTNTPPRTSWEPRRKEALNTQIIAYKIKQMNKKQIANKIVANDWFTELACQGKIEGT
ncbi:uncharacterized protein ASPGLDRAFT_41720 [Aspergillus glaucus CBS 516.65]|uniref:Uncharacterized protein n=1 Tax=Aspergillus glaucus CBS 516.65 TaxID=1160497 RepID=A0A1L9W0J9_ASPGL|nr:hypothetical protein ASPGLDRAFT_41720 [Aspergillus glaucus CBS 516.65]OJJ89694.1 hypothetical protein ASPGLDRAFT_41720 [Aspergillus glaucus CBS 516.65]